MRPESLILRCKGLGHCLSYDSQQAHSFSLSPEVWLYSLVNFHKYFIHTWLYLTWPLSNIQPSWWILPAWNMLLLAPLIPYGAGLCPKSPATHCSGPVGDLPLWMAFGHCGPCDSDLGHALTLITSVYPSTGIHIGTTQISAIHIALDPPTSFWPMAINGTPPSRTPCCYPLMILASSPTSSPSASLLGSSARICTL